MIFLVDLDDTLAETTVCMQGNPRKVHELRLVNGADKFLKRFGKQSILVTAGDRNLQEKKLAVLSIENSFREVHIVRSPKDKLDIFRKLINDTMPNEHVLIGDRLDIETRAGYTLNIPSIRMRIFGGKYYATEPGDVTEVPTHTFYSFEALLQFLERKR